MRVIFILLLFMMLGSCVNDEPVWCEARLYLTIRNSGNIPVNYIYKVNSNNFSWIDSLTMIENDGKKKNKIIIKRNGKQLEPNESIIDTIEYRYYQSDSPCARSGFLANYMVVYLTTNNGGKFNIYPWNPEIFHDDICDGCENINYDTIVID